MRRTLALFLSSIVLWTLVTQLNDALAGWRVYLFAGSLFVAFAALTQPHGPGLAATILGGLVCDAHAPVPFGLHALLFAAAHLALFRIRDRVPRGDNVAAIIVVLLTNLALFLMFSFTQIHAAPLPGATWPRLIADLVCSQVFLALVTPWFFALQAGALKLARVSRFDP
jgi:rod shape-determining protein MreD